MFMFLSRIWCFHHLKNLLEDKPLLLVVTALHRKSEHGAVRRFEEAAQRRGGKMHHLGTIFHATEIPPCYKCGLSRQCKVGGLWDMVGHDEEKLRNFKVTPDKFKRWEDCPRTVAEVRRFAQVLADESSNKSMQATS
jgi:hypothetical protein